MATKIMRGGSWSDGSAFTRVVSLRLLPAFAEYDLGFRVIRRKRKWSPN